jgi:uracil-DNA glycosylase
MRTIEALIDAVQAEARRDEFPIDAPVYAKAERDPTRPILYAGAPGAAVCVFGRDLGKDEVAAGQPLVGAGGRLVREGVYRALHGEGPPSSDRRLESVLPHVLLTNTVPYKPPGNKAYSGSVKERFRPFVAELLAAHWRGDRVITLGTEAFRWFAPYASEGDFDAFWDRDDRYTATLDCILEADPPGSRTPLRKPLTLLPLPHPSPLNQRWYKQFSGLLARRLASVTLSGP